MSESTRNHKVQVEYMHYSHRKIDFLQFFREDDIEMLIVVMSTMMEAIFTIPRNNCTMVSWTRLCSINSTTSYSAACFSVAIAKESHIDYEFWFELDCNLVINVDT